MYRGRFAPSPTGNLHLGSLMTAIASYCDAKKNQGEWLVRIEDLDPPREQKKASKNIIKCLLNCGFKFSAPEYQSTKNHQKNYKAALNQLLENNLAYYCKCSRNQMQDLGSNQHSCRNNFSKPTGEFSIKYKCNDSNLSYIDQIQGQQNDNINNKDDFIILRKDGLYSYQLAVVIDDHKQGITDIIRGIDLIDSTKLQISLASSLGHKSFKYAHLPILTNAEGQKLSKQAHAREVDIESPLSEMIKAFEFLNQPGFPSHPKNTNEFWEHSISTWDINKVPKIKSIKV